MSKIEATTEEKQIRTCVVTGEKHHKADMIRIVSFRGGDILLDLSGKKEGRGCYVTAREDILDNLIERNANKIARVLKKQIKPNEIEYLKAEFPNIVKEKLFRPRQSKPVAVRISKEELESIKKSI